MTFEIFSDILKKFEFAGFRAFVVGGAVRDVLLNRKPENIRIAVSATPQQTKKLFQRHMNSGFSYKHIRITYNKTTYEIASVLSPECENNQDLHIYLSRSDFTINSLAYSIKTGITDFFGGISDIENKLIRFTSEYSVESDPLKLLRAIRYSAALGFDLSFEAENFIEKNAAVVKNAPRERIADDLNRILMSTHPEYIEKAHDTGILTYIFPALDRCFGEPQKNKYHIYDVGKHIMHTLTNTPPDRTLRWSALLHDIGKPCCSSTSANGTIHFYGHHKESVRLASEFFHKYKINPEFTSDVLILIEYHDVRIENTPPAVKRMLSYMGEELFCKLLDLQYADNAAKNPVYLKDKTEKLNQIRDICKTIINNGHPYKINDLLINARDLMNMKCKAGHQINSVLKTLLEEVMINPGLNERTYLLSRAKELIKKA